MRFGGFWEEVSRELCERFALDRRDVDVISVRADRDAIRFVQALRALDFAFACRFGGDAGFAGVHQRQQASTGVALELDDCVLFGAGHIHVFAVRAYRDRRRMPDLDSVFDDVFGRAYVGAGGDTADDFQRAVGGIARVLDQVAVDRDRIGAPAVGAELDLEDVVGPFVDPCFAGVSFGCAHFFADAIGSARELRERTACDEGPRPRGKHRRDGRESEQSDQQGQREDPPEARCEDSYVWAYG